MAQYSFYKSQGGILVPATPDTVDFVTNKLKLGAVVTGEFKRARNPGLHRKFFSLLNLGFEYWTPTGGAVSTFERQFLRGYINRLAHHVDDAGVFYALADEYLQLVAEKRAERLTIAKSFHAFRRWVTVEAGHYDLFELPDGSTLREPRSISFAKMDDLEFNDLYQAALNVLWTFILNKSFPTIAEAENAAAQLMDYAA
ncbi:DUF1367 family protein [Serratia marcescens]|nr:DUF1367 family protein [Serratia marcescens]HEJ7043298.1 DUF1367 family protein [Serratia marcescens]HEJ9018650.1 DUF1367 family protein [Serratia marcescens]HEJ9024380.1 DUF1367 family protein [Serratia marcescens]HEJ9040561.1 DUF1367 family protein [Serratia marcescens]